MDNFLQELKGRYGDVNLLDSIVKNLRNLYGSPKPSTPPKKFSAPAQQAPVQVVWRPVQEPPPPRNKFCPVSIATLDDWLELRDEALNLNELKIFFTGRFDSQSPKFLGMIEEYRKSVEKNLKLPEEIDGDSSFLFVQKLSSALESKFLKILESCHKGRAGNGKNSPSYYFQIEEHVKKYFRRIGLQVVAVEPGTDFHDVQTHMKPTITPAQYGQRHNQIAEVFIPPCYFNYHNDSGNTSEYWISGSCAVYQRGGK